MNPLNLQIIVENEAEMQIFARKLAKTFSKGTIFLKGGLGIGKTTFCRGFLADFLEKQPKSSEFREFLGSPTYNYVQSYDFGEKTGSIHHWDLYRIENAADFVAKGLSDVQNEPKTHLVEWPARVSGAILANFPLPHAVLTISKPEKQENEPKTTENIPRVVHFSLLGQK